MHLTDLRSMHDINNLLDFTKIKLNQAHKAYLSTLFPVSFMSISMCAVNLSQPKMVGRIKCRVPKTLDFPELLENIYAWINNEH